MSNPNGPPKDGPRPGRMGLAAYARVLSVVTHKPMAHDDVAAKLGHAAVTVREVLWRMQHMGLVHVIGWLPHKSQRSVLRAVFKGGSGPSVPYPRELRRPTPGSVLARSQPRPALIHFASIVRAFSEGATREEVRERTGITAANLAPLIRCMRSLGILHICDWTRSVASPGKPAEVLQFGVGRDAPRPKAQSRKAIQERYRNRQRAKRATLQVLRATAGFGSAQRHGVKSFNLLGAGSQA